jgi:hypothetical protein
LWVELWIGIRIARKQQDRRRPVLKRKRGRSFWLLTEFWKARLIPGIQDRRVTMAEKEKTL